MRTLTHVALRALALTVALAASLMAVDTGSVMLTKLSAPDDVRSVGYAAAERVGGAGATRQAAQAALEAARTEADLHGISVHSDDFTLYPDGRITLTGDRTAPTILMKRLPWLEQLALISTTVTVTALPLSSPGDASPRRPTDDRRD